MARDLREDRIEPFLAEIGAVLAGDALDLGALLFGLRVFERRSFS